MATIRRTKLQRHDAMVEPAPSSRCASCGFKLFDGQVVRVRVMRVIGSRCYGKCRCKRLVRLPFVLQPEEP